MAAVKNIRRLQEIATVVSRYGLGPYFRRAKFWERHGGTPQNAAETKAQANHRYA